MRVFPRYVVTAVALVVLCAGCPGKIGTDDGTDVTPPPANPCQPNPCTAPNKTDCSVSNGKAVCACVAGYTPQGDGCQREPTPTCAGQHSLGDAFEPDECPALARMVSTSGPSEPHTLTSSADEDWFRLDATAGTIYEVSAFGDLGLAMRVDLYDADGTTQLASESAGASGTDVAYKARATGSLYARVLSADRASLGSYSVSFGELGTDDLPDTPAQVTTPSLTPDGTAHGGALQFLGDTDVVRVHLEAGHAYVFQAAWSTSLAAALRLELLDTDETTVVLSSESATPRFTTLVSTTGEYFLRVSERSGKQRASYTFTVTDLGIDDHPNTPAQATAVVAGTAYTASKLEYAEDLDVFSFQAEAGHIYQFFCDPQTHFTCDVAFVNEQGSVWKAGSTVSGVSYVANEFTTAGIVYARVTAKAAFADGGYQWVLKDLGKDDYGDVVESAFAVTPSPSASTAAEFELPDDLDVLSFPVAAGHIYEFTCTASGVKCNAVYLTAASATLRTVTASAPGVEAVLQYKFATAGTYYVKLLASGAPPSLTPYSYQWTLKDLGTDDHGETLATATAITPSTSPTVGNLDFLGDEDWFSFQAQANQAFSFTCATGGTFSCGLYLMNSGGTVLVSDTVSGFNAQVIYRMTTAGTYYVRLRALSDAVASYNFQLTDRGVDDHSDTNTSPTVLTLGTATAGKLQVAADVDWFSVPVAASTAYTATLSSAGTGLVFDVYGPDKVTLLASNGVGSKGFTSGSAGNCYVRVKFQNPSASTSNTVASYTMMVK
ncbi:PPC domain-containing protein [Archangium sp.]|uniref:PPC domain-containing protein n=1 Tax=Archangium sp. TaxID=1872627 RepID=UPI003899FCBD